MREKANDGLFSFLSQDSFRYLGGNGRTLALWNPRYDVLLLNLHEIKKECMKGLDLETLLSYADFHEGFHRMFKLSQAIRNIFNFNTVNCQIVLFYDEYIKKYQVHELCKIMYANAIASKRIFLNCSPLIEAVIDIVTLAWKDCWERMRYEEIRETSRRLRKIYYKCHKELGIPLSTLEERNKKVEKEEIRRTEAIAAVLEEISEKMYPKHDRARLKFLNMLERVVEIWCEISQPEEKYSQISERNSLGICAVLLSLCYPADRPTYFLHKDDRGQISVPQPVDVCKRFEKFYLTLESEYEKGLLPKVKRNFENAFDLAINMFQKSGLEVYTSEPFFKEYEEEYLFSRSRRRFVKKILENPCALIEFSPVSPEILMLRDEDKEELGVLLPISEDDEEMIAISIFLRILNAGKVLNDILNNRDPECFLKEYFLVDGKNFGAPLLKIGGFKDYITVLRKGKKCERVCDDTCVLNATISNAKKIKKDLENLKDDEFERLKKIWKNLMENVEHH